MDRLQFVSDIKQLLSAAETEQALEQLSVFLAQDEKYAALLNATIQAQAQLERTRKDEVRGTISFENAKLSYNQITDQALLILDYLEKNKLQFSTPAVPAKSKKSWIYAVVGIILIGFVGVFVLRKINRQNDRTQGIRACPAFEKTADFNILLLPYQPFPLNAPIGTHTAVRRRLGELNDRYNINASVGIYELDIADENSYPSNAKEASKLAEGCSANLVIWGTEERQGDKTLVTTQYRFLNTDGDQFKLKKLKVDQRTEIDTVSSISSIATSGVITQNIEQTILLLFGVVAFESNHAQEAIDLLAKVEVTDSVGSLLQGMILAESYLAMNQNDKALESYDKVLEKHPNYWLALNNRGALYYQKGMYAEAVQDLSARLALNANDLDATAMRGDAYLKTENYAKAKADWETVRKKTPDNTLATKQLQLLENKIEEQKLIQTNADRRLQENPNDLSALKQKAQASKNLGEYQTAVKTAEDILKKDPDNTEAFTTLLESFVELKKPEKVQETLNRIKNSNISKEQLIRKSPTINTLLRQDSALKVQ